MKIKALPANGAILSKDRRYRYVLWRFWGDRRRLVAFCGLNPSTADERENDRTINRCIAFAKKWGFGGMVMLNVFAFRTKSPKIMLRADDPVGPDNDRHILQWVDLTEFTVCCWGANAGEHDRRVMLWIGKKGRALSVTKAGYPGHPLYLRGDLEPQPYGGRFGAGQFKPKRTVVAAPATKRPHADRR